MAESVGLDAYVGAGKTMAESVDGFGVDAWMLRVVSRLFDFRGKVGRSGQPNKRTPVGYRVENIGDRVILVRRNCIDSTGVGTFERVDQLAPGGTLALSSYELARLLARSEFGFMTSNGYMTGKYRHVTAGGDVSGAVRDYLGSRYFVCPGDSLPSESINVSMTDLSVREEFRETFGDMAVDSASGGRVSAVVQADADFLQLLEENNMMDVVSVDSVSGDEEE